MLNWRKSPIVWRQHGGRKKARRRNAGNGGGRGPDLAKVDSFGDGKVVNLDFLRGKWGRRDIDGRMEEKAFFFRMSEEKRRGRGRRGPFIRWGEEKWRVRG